MRVPTTRLASFYFTYFLVLGAFAPYFGPHLEARGLDPGQISVLMGVWYGSRVFAGPLWQMWLTDRRAPGFWLVIGCALTLAGLALFLLPLGLAGLVLTMLLFASFYNAVMPQFEAITLEQLRGARHRYSRVRLWGSVGFLLANLGYGFWLENVGYAALIVWMLPACGLLLCSAWSNRGVADQAGAALTASGNRSASESAHGPRPVAGLLLTAALMQVCHAPFYVYLSLFLVEAGWSAPEIGTAWALGVVAEVGLFLAMPALLQRFDPRRLIALCLLAGALRWWLTAQYPHHHAVVYGMQLLHALTFAMFHSCIMALISEGRSGAGLARAQAWLYGFASGGGGVVGALLAGWCWTAVDHAATFEAAALLSLLILPLLSTLRSHHPDATPTQAAAGSASTSSQAAP